MPNVIKDEYGYINEDSPCWDCKYAYIEDIWFDWMCKAKECPYQAESGMLEQRDKEGQENDA